MRHLQRQPPDRRHALGDDELGHRAFEQLSRQGVRVDAAWRPEPQRRAVCYIDSAGERTITLLSPKLVPRGSDSLPWAELAGADGVYLTGGDAAAVKAARAARVLIATARELPTLKTFATLSPMPGLRHWVERRIAAGDDTLLTPQAVKALRAFEPDAGPGAELLGKILEGPWHRNEALSEALEAPMLRLAARYLLTAKQGNEPLDRVARFHLNNGARVERLNWHGDNSPNGLKQSFGLMVNYLYRPEEIEANHEAYRGEQRVAAGSSIRAALRS